jgi:hypothetical protein
VGFIDNIIIVDGNISYVVHNDNNDYLVEYNDAQTEWIDIV